MALILITGLPGTGKTTVCHELRRRGFEAYDGDEDGLAHWFDESGKAVSREAEERSPEFVSSHIRTIARKTLEDLAEQAKDQPIFICNDPETEEELQDIFSVKFALVLDEAIRQKRLDQRTSNSWGKLPHEREHDLYFAKKTPAMYGRYNYIVLDASQSVDCIIDQILQFTSQQS